LNLFPHGETAGDLAKKFAQNILQKSVFAKKYGFRKNPISLLISPTLTAKIGFCGGVGNFAFFAIWCLRVITAKILLQNLRKSGLCRL
jgi:hypothetical protein